MPDNILDELTKSAVPEDGIPLSADLVLALVLGILLILAIRFGQQSGKRLMHFWVTVPEAKSLGLLQILGGVFWSDSFDRNVHPELKVIGRFAAYAVYCLFAILVTAGIFNTIGAGYFNELFGFS